MPMMTTRRCGAAPLANAAGFSLIEMVVAMGVMTIVMGATMAGLADVTKGSELVLNVTEMNKALRAGMDIVERDMLQVGSGLPPGHVILVPSGAGSTAIRIPGPPGTAFTSVAGDPDIAAVLPSPGRGPRINGVNTDALTVLMADNTFLDVALTAVTASSVTVAAGPDLANGPDRVTTGQLMMISKGSSTTLVEVTGVSTATRVLTFANGDSLNLNQSAAAAGNLAAVNATAPANSPANTRISRIRMITYYLDATTDAAHPRLVRRINNGHPTTFDNTLGTAIAMDIENLTFTFDLNDGATNPSQVAMTAADVNGGGACGANPCSQSQIRKVNIAMTARSRNANVATARSFRNTLASQVAFRGMAFVDEYRQ
jgi:prepilin-type N-terminal cleavage/methylation domain-containing protein